MPSSIFEDASVVERCPWLVFAAADDQLFMFATHLPDLLWMDEILHHLRITGRMTPLLQI